MLQTKEYREKLQEVLKEIENLFDAAEIRGSDAASFIFAQKENCAIELYQSENAVIVEFWKNEEQESEIEVDSYEKAAKLIVDWIENKL